MSKYSKEFESLDQYKSIIGNNDSWFNIGSDRIRYTTHNHCGAKQEGCSTSMFCKTKKQAIDMYAKHIAGMVWFSDNRVIVWRLLPEVSYVDQEENKELDIKKVKGWKVLSRFALATEKEIKRSELNE